MQDPAFLATLLGTGLVFGLKHAFDPDHVAAVSVLVTDTDRRSTAVWYGALWGAGHTTTLLAMGGVALTFRLSIPDRVATGLEGLVGLMLIVLGATALAGRQRSAPGETASWDAVRTTSGLRSFVVGSVHGLAGSAALLLVVLSSVSSVFVGLLYIVVFGLGSILGMLLFSSTLAVTLSATTSLALSAASGPALARGVSVLAGLASVLIGGLIVYRCVPF